MVLDLGSRVRRQAERDFWMIMKSNAITMMRRKIQGVLSDTEYFNKVSKHYFDELDSCFENLQKLYGAKSVRSADFSFIGREYNSKNLFITSDVLYKFTEYLFENFQEKTEREAFNKISDFRRVIKDIRDGNPLFLIRNQAIETDNFLSYLHLRVLGSGEFLRFSLLPLSCRSYCI